MFLRETGNIMKRFTRALVAMTSGVILLLGSACSADYSIGGSEFGDEKTGATLVSPSNQAEYPEYEYGNYSDSDSGGGYLQFDCKEGQEQVLLDDLPGVSREVSDQFAEMTVHFGDVVPSAVLIRNDYATMVYALDGNTRNYVFDMWPAGVYDHNEDGSYHDFVAQYGGINPENHRGDPIMTVCVG